MPHSLLICINKKLYYNGMAWASGIFRRYFLEGSHVPGGGRMMDGGRIAALPALCLHFKCVRTIDQFMNIRSSMIVRDEE
jgi:hypothetical protein